MATNQLLPFGMGESPNRIPFEDWNILPSRLTGFQSGIASSQQFNYILAQGGVAGYILAQLIVEQLAQDATLESADTLYTNFKSALAKFIPNAVADGAIRGAKITDASIAFAKLAAAAIASQAEAEAGTANDVLMTPLRVAQLLSEQMPPAFPTGMILPFAATAIPEGFLACNGSNVSRTTYANLFSVIGTRYGAGDGSTTFTLPNLHRRFAEFSTTISEIGQAVEAGLPNIIGNVSTFASWAGGANDGALIRYESQNANIAGGSGQAIKVTIGFNAAHSFALYGKSSFVQPASLRFLPCIKA